MKINISEEFHKELIGYYERVVRIVSVSALAFLYLASIIYNLAALNVDVSSRAVFSIYVIFIGCVTSMIALAVMAVYKSVVLHLVRCGKFKMCKTKRKRVHFVNVRKSKKKYQSIVYARVLLDLIFVEGVELNECEEVQVSN